MNKRIDKLFGQALDEAVPETWTTLNPAQLTRLKEKFAELIVRECVRVMYDNAIERNVPPDINQTPTHYAVAVLEHFGVEE
jgi:hypothetical protein